MRISILISVFKGLTYLLRRFLFWSWREPEIHVILKLKKKKKKIDVQYDTSRFWCSKGVSLAKRFISQYQRLIKVLKQYSIMDASHCNVPNKRMLLRTIHHSQFNHACFALRTICNCAQLSDYGSF